MTKDEIIKSLKNRKIKLIDVSPEDKHFLSDKDVALAALSIFDLPETRINGNEQISYVSALEFLPDFQNDIKVVLLALENSYCCDKFISRDLLLNKDFLLKAFEIKDVSNLIPNELLVDEEFLQKLINEECINSHNALKIYKKIIEINKEDWFKKSCIYSKFLELDFRVFESVKDDDGILNNSFLKNILFKSIVENNNTFREYVKNNGLGIFEYFFTNKEDLEVLIKRSYSMLKYSPLKSDGAFIRDLMSKEVMVMDFKLDNEINVLGMENILKMFESFPRSYKVLSLETQHNKKLLLKYINKIFINIMYVSEEMKWTELLDDCDFRSEFIKLFKKQVKIAPDEIYIASTERNKNLKKLFIHKDFIKEISVFYKDAIYLIPQDLKEDKEILYLFEDIIMKERDLSNEKHLLLAFKREDELREKMLVNKDNDNISRINKKKI